jgi:hypothetical protein
MPEVNEKHTEKELEAYCICICTSEDLLFAQGKGFIPEVVLYF